MIENDRPSKLTTKIIIVVIIISIRVTIVAFAFFSQCGYQHREVEYLAIGHSSLHLLRKEGNQYQIMQTLT